MLGVFAGYILHVALAMNVCKKEINDQYLRLQAIKTKYQKPLFQNCSAFYSLWEPTTEV